MFGFGLAEMVVILVVALIVFGPGKLPQVGKALGSSLREFRDATRALDDDRILPDESEPRDRGADRP